MVEPIKLFFIMGIINILLMVFVMTMQSSADTKIGMVNITGMVNSFIKETAQQPLSAGQKQEKIARFGEALQKVVESEARENHMILIPSEAVIAGADDVTKEVMVAIKRELKS